MPARATDDLPQPEGPYGQQTDALPDSRQSSPLLDQIPGEFFAAKKQVAGASVKCVQASIRVRADFAEFRWCSVRWSAYGAAQPPTHR